MPKPPNEMAFILFKSENKPKTQYEQASDLRPENGLFSCCFFELVAFRVFRMNIIVIVRMTIEICRQILTNFVYNTQYIQHILKTYRRRAVMIAVCGQMC